MGWTEKIISVPSKSRFSAWFHRSFTKWPKLIANHSSPLRWAKLKTQKIPQFWRTLLKYMNKPLSGFDIDDILVGHSWTVFGSSLSDFESGALGVFGYTYLKTNSLIHFCFWKLYKAESYSYIRGVSEKSGLAAEPVTLDPKHQERNGQVRRIPHIICVNLVHGSFF